METHGVFRVESGPLGGRNVIVGILDAEPSELWADVFHHVARPAFFGFRPHLRGDRIVMIADLGRASDARGALTEAVFLANELIQDHTSAYIGADCAG